jgi:hypothetical protein
VLETVESCKISHGRVGVGVTLYRNVGFATLNPIEVLNPDTANGVLMASLEIKSNRNMEN